MFQKVKSWDMNFSSPYFLKDYILRPLCKCIKKITFYLCMNGSSTFSFLCIFAFSIEYVFSIFSK